MQCLILFRDASGWLPTAQEMSRCGFCVSAAALPAPDALAVALADAVAEEMSALGSALELAAEPVCEYGAKPPAAPTGDRGAGQGAEPGLP